MYEMRAKDAVVPFQRRNALKCRKVRQKRHLATTGSPEGF